MNSKIEIKGLSFGEHSFDFHFDGAFFEAYENDTISDADLDVCARLTKAAGWVKLDMSVTGKVVVACDRCLAELEIPVDVEAPFTVVFSSLISDDGEDSGGDVIVLDRNEAELDLSQIIYDYVCLSLPIKKVHEDGKCDPVMLEKMKDILK